MVLFRTGLYTCAPQMLRRTGIQVLKPYQEYPRFTALRWKGEYDFLTNSEEAFLSFSSRLSLTKLDTYPQIKKKWDKESNSERQGEQ